MSGELLAVRLLVPHGDKSAGEVVLVDRLRALAMEQNEVGSIEPPATEEYNLERFLNTPAHLISADIKKDLSGPPVDKMVRKAPKRKRKGGA